MGHLGDDPPVERGCSLGFLSLSVSQEFYTSESPGVRQVPQARRPFPRGVVLRNNIILLPGLICASRCGGNAVQSDGIRRGHIAKALVQKRVGSTSAVGQPRE